MFLVSAWNMYTLEYPSKEDRFTSNANRLVFGINLSSVSQYLQNPQWWQQWKVNAYNKGALTPARIVGLVPAGSHYIAILHTEGFYITQSYYSLTITSGPFRGMAASRVMPLIVE